MAEGYESWEHTVDGFVPSAVADLIASGVGCRHDAADRAGVSFFCVWNDADIRIMDSSLNEDQYCDEDTYACCYESALTRAFNELTLRNGSLSTVPQWARNVLCDPSYQQAILPMLDWKLTGFEANMAQKRARVVFEAMGVI